MLVCFMLLIIYYYIEFKKRTNVIKIWMMLKYDLPKYIKNTITYNMTFIPNH